jgi:hypothetical protein
MKFKPAIIATLSLAISFIMFSCQLDDQIEEKQETKIISKETVFTFSINHSEQLISSELGTDLSWDWQSVNQVVPAFIAYPLSSNIAKLDITAPWYTQGNPLNTNEIDIYSKDGWVLVMRNFGSPENGVPRAYFGLLNTKTNLLRIFIHNSQLQSGNYLESKLTLVASQDAPIRSFESKPSKIIQFDSWFNLEFQLEPNQLKPDFENFQFLLECTGIAETVIG